jgi:hypothetical protein
MVYALELNEESTLKRTRDLLFQMNTELINKFGKTRAMKHLRGDADTAFGQMLQRGETHVIGPEEAKRLNRLETIQMGQFWIKSSPVTQFLYGTCDLYLNSSPYTNKNRIVDRVIRTIRDKIGNARSMMDPDKVTAVVNKYNNTPHSAFNHEFTPFEVQSNLETEDYFIRENSYKLQEIKQLQRNEGLFNYQSGNILHIHLSELKTEQKFDKRRRNFDKLVEFIGYEFGNVVCRLLTINVNDNGSGFVIIRTNKVITIPIYHTKYVSRDVNSIPLAYKKALAT